MIAGWTAGSWTPLVHIDVPVKKTPVVDLKKRYPTGEVIYSAPWVGRQPIPTFNRTELK